MLLQDIGGRDEWFPRVWAPENEVEEHKGFINLQK
jgi:hypothetical protein